MITLEQIGRAIHYKREFMGMTAWKLHEQSAVHMKTVLNIEKGLSGCRISSMFKMLDTLDLEIKVDGKVFTSKNFGELLSELRQKQKLDIEEVANLTGFFPNAICKLEEGSVWCNIQSLLYVLEALDASVTLSGYVEVDRYGVPTKLVS